MKRRNRLAWKLSVVVLVIVSTVILGAGFLGSLLSRQYTLGAAREIMRFNSSSICNGLEKLMMGGDNTGVIEFIGEMSRSSSTYQDMSLISHPDGEIFVSQELGVGDHLGMSDSLCTLCHRASDLPRGFLRMGDEVITNSAGNRVLQVVTPITNKPACRNAECHVHKEDGQVLGILKTDYSLSSFDEFMSGLNVLLSLAAVLAIVLAIGALLLMFRWILAKPLRRLVTGIGTLAEGDLGFRFPARADDEIGLVEDSFNNMAAQIQNHQAELRHTLEHLQGIVENTADIVLVVDRDDFVITFNRGAELALGYRRKEVLGRRIEILLADSRERELAIARLREKDDVTNWQARFKTKDGRIRHVLLTISRVRDSDGHLVGTIGIGKDITVELDLLDKLKRTEQEAAIGRAVTGIQHAIKNMLNTLKGGVYIARVGQRKGDNDQILEGCEMVDEGLTQISDLSMNMLRYAREWKIDPEPVDLTEMAGKITSAVAHTAKERGVTVRTESTGSAADVVCDPRLLHMGLMDIVSNALDACLLKEYSDRDVPEVVIRVRPAPDDQSAVIEVEDNGIGMTSEIARDVFTPFFSTKKKTGTGLGLALTKRIIDLHDGEIIVESEPDVGTVFRITLPIDVVGQRTKDS